MAPRILTIKPRGELCLFATYVLVAILLSLVMGVVVNQISKNNLRDTTERRNERLKSFLLYLESLNDTIHSAPTPNPLTVGVFVEQVPFITTNRGPTVNQVPSSVDQFNVGTLNVTTKGNVFTESGIFRIQDGVTIDCCALASTECDETWVPACKQPTCCGSEVQLDPAVGCGLNFSPEQFLSVSNLIPSDTTGSSSSTLEIKHGATVTSGRVSYGGRQIPIQVSEYLIALNTSRRWTMADLAPCGLPLQGTKDRNPCLLRGVRYPVDVVATYVGLENNCFNSYMPPAKKNVTDVFYCTQPPNTSELDFTYDKPINKIQQAQYRVSRFASFFDNFVQINNDNENFYDWSACRTDMALFPNPYANFSMCVVGDGGKPTSNCATNALGIAIAGCGSLRDPVRYIDHVGAPQSYCVYNSAFHTCGPGSPPCPPFDEGLAFYGCLNTQVCQYIGIVSCTDDAQCNVAPGIDLNMGRCIDVTSARYGTCSETHSPLFSTDQEISIQTPMKMSASYVFDPHYTYATTPKFDLVDGAVYEIGFGGTAMGFLPFSKQFTNPVSAEFERFEKNNGGFCSSFNIKTLNNDACGGGSCGFYFNPSDLLNCVNGSCTRNGLYPNMRTPLGSASMSFQLYALCMAVPANDVAGFNPAVFELIDVVAPFVFDYSLNAQTHQLDGKAYYLINATKLQTWQALFPDITVWKGQCGLFMASTPLMVTKAQQGAFRTVAVETDPFWTTADLAPCMKPLDIFTIANAVGDMTAFGVGAYTSAETIYPDTLLEFTQCNPLPFSSSPTATPTPRPDAGTQCSANQPQGTVEFTPGKPMGYNHFCQTSRVSMFNTYLEVQVALPGITVPTPTPSPSCTPVPTCTPTPVPTPTSMKKRLVIHDEEDP